MDKGKSVCPSPTRGSSVHKM